MDWTIWQYFVFFHTDFLWFISHTICLIVPFAFCTYSANMLYGILIPMSGYQQTSSNPQILIGGIAIAWCLLVGGFLLPSLYLFRKAKIIISTFMVVWIVCIILGATSIGFPYEPKTAVQRIYVQVCLATIFNGSQIVNKCYFHCYLLA